MHTSLEDAKEVFQCIGCLHLELSICCLAVYQGPHVILAWPLCGVRNIFFGEPAGRSRMDGIFFPFRQGTSLALGTTIGCGRSGRK